MSCSHGTYGLDPRWRGRQGISRPDDFPMGRDRMQGRYVDDRPSISPFRDRPRRRTPQYIDDDLSDEDYPVEDEDDGEGAYEDDDSESNATRLQNLIRMGRGGRRQSYLRERGRPRYLDDRSYTRNERPSRHDARPYEDFEDDMYGRSGRSRGNNMMYVDDESKRSSLSY